MSAQVWGKFFWSDWANDPKLRLCSFAAQGLWMRMLCIAAESDPTGYVVVNGNALDETGIARLTGANVSEVADLLGELDRNGVFSRDRQRRIYSRRMVRDAKKRAEAVKNGRKGGNPSLGKDGENPPSDNPPVKGEDKPQKPEARDQKIEPIAQQAPLPRAEPMLFDKLCAAAGFDPQRLPHPKLLQLGAVLDLLAKRYDLDADILPVVRDLRAAGASFQSWSYIVPIVIDRVSKRAAIPARAEPEADDWPARLKYWREGAPWGAWGPKPGERGCRVPAELLLPSERTAA